MKRTYLVPLLLLLLAGLAIPAVVFRREGW